MESEHPIIRLGLDVHCPGNRDPFEIDGRYFQIVEGTIRACCRMPVNNPRFRRKLKREGWVTCRVCGNTIHDWDAVYFNYVIGAKVVLCCKCTWSERAVSANVTNVRGWMEFGMGLQSASVAIRESLEAAIQGEAKEHVFIIDTERTGRRLGLGGAGTLKSFIRDPCADEIEDEDENRE